MSRCPKCAKKITLANSLKCKWCSCDVCIGCISLEAHNCKSLLKFKINALHDLNNNLLNGKTEDKKYIKI